MAHMIMYCGDHGWLTVEVDNGLSKMLDLMVNVAGGYYG